MVTINLYADSILTAMVSNTMVMMTDAMVSDPVVTVTDPVVVMVVGAMAMPSSPVSSSARHSDLFQLLRRDKECAISNTLPRPCSSAARTRTRPNKPHPRHAHQRGKESS